MSSLYSITKQACHRRSPLDGVSSHPPPQPRHGPAGARDGAGMPDALRLPACSQANAVGQLPAGSADRCAGLAVQTLWDWEHSEAGSMLNSPTARIQQMNLGDADFELSPSGRRSSVDSVGSNISSEQTAPMAMEELTPSELTADFTRPRCPSFASVESAPTGFGSTRRPSCAASHESDTRRPSFEGAAVDEISALLADDSSLFMNDTERAVAALEKHDDLLAHFSEEEIFAICASRAMEAHQATLLGPGPPADEAKPEEVIADLLLEGEGSPVSSPLSPSSKGRRHSRDVPGRISGAARATSNSMPSSPLAKRPPASGSLMPKRRKPSLSCDDGASSQNSSPLAARPFTTKSRAPHSLEEGGVIHMFDGFDGFDSEDLPDLPMSSGEGTAQGEDAPASSRKNKLQRCSACGARATTVAHAARPRHTPRLRGPSVSAYSVASPAPPFPLPFIRHPAPPLLGRWTGPQVAHLLPAHIITTARQVPALGSQSKHRIQ